MNVDDLLRRSPPAVGTWLMSGSPNVAEALACRGFDYLVIDIEHVAMSLESVMHMVRAIEARGKIALVRLADHDPARLRWMLDSGVNHLMVPMIESAEDARTVAAVACYPPEGVRGFAGMLRANAYGADSDYFTEARSRVALIAQIETPRALESMEDIADVPGIDAVFLGPGDLSATTGRLGGATHEDTLALVQGGIERCAARGIAVGTVMPRPELVRRMLDAGCTFAAVASDMGFVTAAAAAALDAVRTGDV